jgi:hypothetical protein
MMAITSFMWLPLKSVVPALAAQIGPSRFFPVAGLTMGDPVQVQACSSRPQKSMTSRIVPVDFYRNREGMPADWALKTASCAYLLFSDNLSVAEAAPQHWTSARRRTIVHRDPGGGDPSSGRIAKRRTAHHGRIGQPDREHAHLPHR